MSTDIYEKIIESETAPTPRSFEKATSDTIVVNDDIRNDKILRYRYNSRLRKFMSTWALIVVTLWIFCIGLYICLNDNKVTPPVLITLLSTTTINIIAILLICFKDIFHGKSEDGM